MFKTKKKVRINYCNIFMLFVCTFISISSFLFFYNIKLYSSNEEFINSLLANSNHYKKYSNNIINKMLTIFYSSSTSKPISLLSSTFNINDDISYDEDYDVESLETISQHISDPDPKEITDPLVYIYNSHQLENYSGSNYEAYNITPNVMMASYIMREKLNDLGIKTIVEENDITEFMRINNWDYNYSYMASRYYLEDVMKKYPSLEYFIDLHRDALTKVNSTTVIDNKSYAKILFVVGLEHENYKLNLELVNSINNKLLNKYPSLTKGIMTKKGPNVNGIYNQDISPNAILIEIGGNENTIDEVYNTIELISTILKEVINER